MAIPDTKIESVELFTYHLTYRHGEYVMSKHRSVRRLQSAVIKVTTRGGISGYGEVCPLGSTYLPGFAQGAIAALEELAPALLGQDVLNPVGISARLDRVLAGHAYAKSGMDMAVLDAAARCLELPLHVLLGGQLSETLPLYVAIPLGEPERMAEAAKEERARGIQRFQLKLGEDPAMDAERTLAVLEATGQGDVVVADANGGWCQADALAFLKLIGGADRLVVEQPCRSLEECLAVRDRCPHPMVLDEVICNVADLARAVSARAMDQLNLKIGRVGGLSRARLLRDAALELGIRLTIEDTWGGDLVTAATIQLAAGVPPNLLFAVSYMNEWSLEHLAPTYPTSIQGQGRVPQTPGLGVEVDTETIGEPLFKLAAK